jgi:hypothetical protein
MKPRFLILSAANRPDFTEIGGTSPSVIGKPLPILLRSAYQLEHLVGQQGDDAKHEMQPDFFRSPYHHVAAAKLFFQATVEALRGRPFLVSGFLMGGQGE